ncbi:MAG TPA: glycoside hydrolase family 36 protein [Sphingomonas sp.]|nr:glycoside hydrolase family 36 protein [Sphingomonas sp.]
MQRQAITRRDTLTTLLCGTAAAAGGTLLPARAWGAAAPAASVSDGVLTIDFDGALHSRVSRRAQALTALEGGEGVRLADGAVLDRFVMLDQDAKPLTDAEGPGRRHLLRGIAEGRLEKRLELVLRDRYPGAALMRVTYRNLDKQPVAIAGWWSAAHTVLAHPKGAWTFAGASYPDRRDWVQPVLPDFQQRNFMGMNGSDYGSGTPVAVVWRPDAGLAIGHVETAPRLIALPVAAQPGGTRIAIEGDQPIVLAPGESVTLPETFIMTHQGDHFAALDTYRRVMAERGLAAPAIPESSYDPIWCAWGYERNFTPAQVYGTLDKAKSVGCDWAVLDDGWQKAVGDWVADTGKFPEGNAGLKAFADRIKTYGMRPKLWISPLSASPTSDLMRDHRDMLLLDASGAAQNVTWWDSYTLCPAYQPTIDYFKAVTRRIIGDWGWEGLKIDGQDLNGVAPCYNPAHNHARPEESVEKLQDFWKAIYETAIGINPNANIEICPCGDSFAFFNIPAMNNTPASDPESSWQVRLKGKTFKAMMGPSAPFSGDHVELSDGGDDFASTYGIGGIPSTKFTWPKDTDRPTDKLPPGGFVLTPEKEQLWRKWIALYRKNMLSKGQYRGELYDIGFDKPEGHVVAADGTLHYAFYAKSWKGPIELRGLGKGRYRLTNSFTGEPLGTASAADNRIDASFDRFLVIEAAPAGAAV